VTPLVREAFDWNHGVFLGATMSSEMTAAAAGTVGQLRFDPMAMLPFCGYNMADYFGHWVTVGEQADAAKLPKIFYVNWFRKSAAGKFLWPGFGDNSRVLKWMCERIDGKAGARKTAIGLLPEDGGLDLGGLNVPAGNMDEILAVDTAAWKAEIPSLEKHFEQFGAKLPARMKAQLEELKKRLG
jgi:phosphoenolpyruvate carboxykinase (GTP)